MTFLSGSQANAGPIKLIKDPRFQHLNAGVLNRFGATGSIVSAVDRWDQGWSIDALNGVIHHGANPFDFTTIPASPNPKADARALGMWCVSGGVPPQLRINYGLSLEELKKSDQWQLTGRILILPNNSSNYAATIGQNLTNPVSINLVDINIDNLIGLLVQVLDSTGGYFLIPDLAVNMGTIHPSESWQSFSATFSIPASSKKYMNPFGHQYARLMMSFSNQGHIRYCLDDVQITSLE
jgi:hypothetical protein